MTTDSESPPSSQVVAPAAQPAENASRIMVNNVENKDRGEDGDEDEKTRTEMGKVSQPKRR